jgi:hypothetical protein
MADEPETEITTIAQANIEQFGNVMIRSQIDAFNTESAIHEFSSGASVEIINFEERKDEGRLALFREINPVTGESEVVSYTWLKPSTTLYRVEDMSRTTEWLQKRLISANTDPQVLAQTAALITRPFYIIEEPEHLGFKYYDHTSVSTERADYVNLEPGSSSPEVVSPSYAAASVEERQNMSIDEGDKIRLITEARSRLLQAIAVDFAERDLPVVSDEGDTQVIIMPVTASMEKATTVPIRNNHKGQEVVKEGKLSGNRVLIAEVDASGIVRFLQHDYKRALMIEPTLLQTKSDKLSTAMRAISGIVGYDQQTHEARRASLIEQVRALKQTEQDYEPITQELKALDSAKAQYESITTELLYQIRENAVQANQVEISSKSVIETAGATETADPALLYTKEQKLAFLSQSPDLKSHIKRWKSEAEAQTMESHMQSFAHLSLTDRLTAIEFYTVSPIEIPERIAGEILESYGAEPTVEEWSQALERVVSEQVEKRTADEIERIIIAAGKYHMLENVRDISSTLSVAESIAYQDMRMKAEASPEAAKPRSKENIIIVEEDRAQLLVHEKSETLMQVRAEIREIISEQEVSGLDSTLRTLIARLADRYGADPLVISAQKLSERFKADKAHFGGYTEEMLLSDFAVNIANGIFDREIREAGIHMLGKYRVSGGNDLEEAFSVAVSIHDAISMDIISNHVELYEKWLEAINRTDLTMIAKVQSLEALGIKFAGRFTDLMSAESLSRVIEQEQLSSAEVEDLVDVLDIMMPQASWGAHQTAAEIISEALQIVRPESGQQEKTINIMVATGGHPKVGLMLGSYLDSLVAAEAANRRRQYKREIAIAAGQVPVGQALRINPVFLVAHNAAGVVNHYDAPELREVNALVAEMNYQSVQRYLRLPFVRAEVLGVSEADLVSYSEEEGVIEIEKLEDEPWSEGSSTLAFQELSLPYLRELYVNDQGESTFAQTIEGLSSDEAKRLNAEVAKAIITDKDVAKTIHKLGALATKVGVERIAEYLEAAKALRAVVEMGKKRNDGKMSEEEIVENSMRYAVMHTIYFGDLVVDGLEILPYENDQINHIADDEGEFKGVRDYLSRRLIGEGKARRGSRRMDVRTRTCEARKPYYTLESLPNAWKLAANVELFVGYLTAPETMKFKGENEEEVASRFLDTNRLLRMPDYPAAGDLEDRDAWEAEKERRARIYISEVLLANIEANPEAVATMKSREVEIETYLRKVNPKAFAEEV